MTSTLGIKKIQYPNGTNSITIDSSGSAAITTANITTAAITTANVTNATATGTITTPSINGSQIGGRRNIVINGGMQIWQRGTSFSVADNIYTCDRWLTEFGGLGAFTLSRSTDTPGEFGYSLKLDCTTADASPAAGDVFQLFHRIEGQNLQQLKKGTASAEKVTLSFFVKSNKTGNMQVNLRDANSRLIGNIYTINSANTWERKTITFDGDTSGTIANDNTAELTIEFPISSGSTYTSGAVPTSWEATSNADRNAGSTINLADNTSNEWYLTGVQLEVGSQATAFEHRGFGEEELLCKRYFCQFTDPNSMIGIGGYQRNDFADVNVQFPVPMRNAPSLVQASGSNYYGITRHDNNENFNSFVTAFGSSNKNMLLYVGSGLSGTQGSSARFYTSANGSIAFNAEL